MKLLRPAADGGNRENKGTKKTREGGDKGTLAEGQGGTGKRTLAQFQSPQQKPCPKGAARQITQSSEEVALQCPAESSKRKIKAAPRAILCRWAHVLDHTGKTSFCAFGIPKKSVFSLPRFWYFGHQNTGFWALKYWFLGYENTGF